MKRLSGSLEPNQNWCFSTPPNPTLLDCASQQGPCNGQQCLHTPRLSASRLLAFQRELLPAAMIDCCCSCRVMPYSSHPNLYALVSRLVCIMSAVQRASTCLDFCCRLAPHATAVSYSAGRLCMCLSNCHGVQQCTWRLLLHCCCTCRCSLPLQFISATAHQQYCTGLTSCSDIFFLSLSRDTRQGIHGIKGYVQPVKGYVRVRKRLVQHNIRSPGRQHFRIMVLENCQPARGPPQTAKSSCAQHIPQC